MAKLIDVLDDPRLCEEIVKSNTVSAQLFLQALSKHTSYLAETYPNIAAIIVRHISSREQDSETDYGLLRLLCSLLAEHKIHVKLADLIPVILQNCRVISF